MSNDTRPMYERIYDSLLEDIKCRVYKAGDRLPSEHELAHMNNVSRITSKKALEMLSAKNLIVRKPGKGSFVSENINEVIANDVQETKKKKDLFLGLIIPDFGNVYATKIVHSIEEEARKNGVFFLLRRTQNKEEEEKTAIREMLRIGVDALIIFPVQEEYFNEEILKLVVNKFPFLLIDRYLKGIPAVSVSTNNKQASIDIVNYLFERNHKHIALVAPYHMNTTAIEDRIAGFTAAFEAVLQIPNKELWFTGIQSLNFEFESMQEIRKDIDNIKILLRDHKEITAIFATEYRIALLCEMAAKELGMKIKEDLSIVCFDSPDGILSSSVQFTHIKQNEKEIGRAAYEKVMSMNQEENYFDNILIEYELIEGESTGINSATH